MSPKFVLQCLYTLEGPLRAKNLDNLQNLKQTYECVETHKNT